MNPSDFPKSVTEIASYFTLPFIQLIAIALLLGFVGGIDVAATFAKGVRVVFGSDAADTIQFLRDVHLLELVPLIALFLFMLLLVGMKRSVASLAQVLPPQIALEPATLLSRLADPQHTLALWGHFPQLDIGSVIATMEARIVDLQFSSNDNVLTETKYWKERAAFFMRGYDTLKVLAYITILCALVAVARADGSAGLVLRTLSALSLILIGAGIALVQSLHCTFQSYNQLAELWSRSDEIWKPTDEVTSTQERLDALRKVALARWWHWRFIKAGSLAHYWDILRGGAA